ncbi:hypothetical protein K3495_g9932 [Podosphaera aphanis]|nr:hypothetical protein K3495_g9932 [Podosphaera aphanis]
MTTKELSRRQVRWRQRQSRLSYSTVTGPPKNNSDSRLLHQKQFLLPSHKLHQSITQDLQEKIENPPNPICNASYLSSAIVHKPKEEPLDCKIARPLEEGYTDKKDKWLAEVVTELTKPEGVPHSKEISLPECEFREGRLYFRDRLYVPDNELRLFLIQKTHDSCEKGYPGKNALYQAISDHYWWPNLSQQTDQFVRNCHNCIRNKVSRLRYQGTLKSLPLPDQRWRDISVDFVGPLTEFNNFNCIMVVIDRLTKERHYIPCHTKMKAKDLAKIFVRNVWRLHGLCDSIVSDRGPLFVAEFWKAVCHRLQINVSLSTSYHPETDGQTENANAYMEQYLRQYIDYSQEDVYEWLPMAKFAANNAVNTSTQISPFFANKVFHPRMSFGPPRPISRTPSKHLREQIAGGNDFASKMAGVLDVLRSNLARTRDRQEKASSANRSPAPVYRVGDEVFLDTRNITTSRPIKKLDCKFIGHFRVTKIINSNAYQLELPFEHENLHNVFHTSLLRPAPTNPLPGQTNPPPPPIALDESGEKLFAIEAIVDSKRSKNKKNFHYLIL